jgi:hypothetical protein
MGPAIRASTESQLFLPVASEGSNKIMSAAFAGDLGLAPPSSVYEEAGPWPTMRGAAMR